MFDSERGPLAAPLTATGRHARLPARRPLTSRPPAQQPTPARPRRRSRAQPVHAGARPPPPSSARRPVGGPRRRRHGRPGDRAAGRPAEPGHRPRRRPARPWRPGRARRRRPLPDLPDVVAAVRDSVVTITSKGFSSRGFAQIPSTGVGFGHRAHRRWLHPDQQARRRRQRLADRRARRRRAVPGHDRQGIRRHRPRPHQDRGDRPEAGGHRRLVDAPGRADRRSPSAARSARSPRP